MKPEDQVKALADLDGWLNVHESGRLDGQLVGYPPCGLMKYQGVPAYLTSYDAIIPLIQKHSESEKMLFGEWLAEALGYGEDWYEGWNMAADSFAKTLTATPAELCEALLRATGKWKN